MSCQFVSIRRGAAPGRSAALSVLCLVSVCLFLARGLDAFARDAAQSQTEEKVYSSFCASEGMLAWWGDPELSGPVSMVRVAHFEAGRDENGALTKKNAGQPVYYAEFHISADGELIQSVRSHTGKPEDNQVTKYEVNARLLFDERNKTAAFRYESEYDAQGRLAAEHLYQGDRRLRTERCFTYDEEGRLKTVRNSLNQIVTYTYDEAGRPLREDWSMPGAVGAPFSSLLTTYDSQGRTIASTEINRSTRFAERNTVFEKRWLYDACGRLVRVQRFILEPRNELLGEEIHEYDLQGRPVRRTLVGETGAITNWYVYNDNGAIVQINRQVREPSGWKFQERIHFTLDERGNWLRAAMESEKRPCIIERVIEYY